MKRIIAVNSNCYHGYTTEEIVEGMRKGVKDGLITPVFCGSAVNQQALDMLLYNMHKLLPSPAHDAFILAENANGEPVELHCTEEDNQVVAFLAR